MTTSAYTLDLLDMSGGTVLADVLTNELSPELTVGYALDSIATCSFKLPVTQTGVTRSNFDPGNRTLVLKQDGTPIWGGFLLASSADHDWASFSGKDWLFALSQNIVSINEHFLDVDELDIAWTLINTFCDIAFTRGSATPSGFPRRRHYCCNDMTTVFDAVSELATNLHGFDFWITPTKVWNTVVGLRGADRTATVIFDDMVNLTEVNFTDDAESVVNRDWFVPPNILSCADMQYRDYGGSPAAWVRESGVDLSSIDLPADRSDIISEALRNSGPPRIQVTGTVDVQTGIDVGSFDLGDKVRCKLSRGYMTMDQSMRVLDYTVTIKDSCVQQMSVTLDNVLT